MFNFAPSIEYDTKSSSIGRRTAKGGGMKFRAWHNRTQNSHESERDEYKARGFQFISLSLHGSVAEPRWVLSS